MRTPCIQASSPTLTTAVSSWSPAGPVGGALELAEAEVLLDAEEEARAADAAHQNSDFHSDRH